MTDLIARAFAAVPRSEWGSGAIDLSAAVRWDVQPHGTPSESIAIAPAPRMRGVCPDCEAPIWSATGRCRSCAAKRRNAKPVVLSHADLVAAMAARGDSVNPGPSGEPTGARAEVSS